MPQFIQFSKMHGLGNDFVLIDAINQLIQIDAAMVKVMADRHFGIGFDQLLLVEKSHTADFACRIFNSDGSEAEQCGNGMRCVARFIQEESLSNNKSLTIQTKSGIVHIIINDFDNIQVTMGVPRLEPKQIPFLTNATKPLYDLELSPDRSIQIAVLSMGNPHAILRIHSVKDKAIAEIGPTLSIHPHFPHGTNVGFMEIINRQKIRLRTFERGAGETLACGSNACAAVVAGIINEWLDNQVIVELAHGNLFLEWKGINSPVIMTGPASRVFSGVVAV